MRRLRLAGLLPIFMACAALTASVGRAAENPFSGLWNTTLSAGVTGTVTFRVISSADGVAALRSMGGQPCTGATVYYHGDYTDTAPDTGTMTACISPSGTLVGRYRNGNTKLPYPGGSFSITIDSSGKSFSGFFTADDPAFSGTTFPYNGTFVKHVPGDGCCPGSSPPPPSGNSDGTLGAIRGKVEVQLGGGGWQPATTSIRLKPGDRVHTGWKGSVVISLRGAKIEVGPMTLVVIQGGSDGEATGILKFGYIKEKPLTLDEYLKWIHYPLFPLSKIIFRHGYRPLARHLLGRSATLPVFAVLYDAAAGATLVSVTRGSLVLDPDGPGLSTVTVGAGSEVEITRTTESSVAPIGKAGAPPGSVDRVRAREVVLAAAAAGSTRCGAQATGVRLTRLTLGWTVALQFAGRVSGSAVWTIRGTRVAPANPLAAEIAAGCPGSAGAAAKAGHYAGKTSQGKPVSFDVSADGRSLSNVTAGALVDCVGGSKGAWTLTFSGRTALDSTLRFSRSYTGALTTGASTTNVKVSDSISGQLDSAGGATGTFTLSRISWDQAGKHYDCTGKAVSWTARR